MYVGHFHIEAEPHKHIERRVYHLYIYVLHGYFFFFQAEDGIRDLIVTGVQTCALPISGTSRWGSMSAIRTRMPISSRAATRRGRRGQHRSCCNTPRATTTLSTRISTARDRKSVV